MKWIVEHWQTIAAFAIVALTLALFARNFLRSQGSKSGCGEGCGCDAKSLAGKTAAERPGTSTVR